MNETQEVGRSKRVKAAASISAALSLLVGGLLFAEHDASASHTVGHFDLGNLNQSINLGSQTGLSQTVPTDGGTINQAILLPAQNNPAPLNCAALLQNLAGSPLSITQSIQFACPAISG